MENVTVTFWVSVFEISVLYSLNHHDRKADALMEEVSKDEHSSVCCPVSPIKSVETGVWILLPLPIKSQNKNSFLIKIYHFVFYVCLSIERME
jgi:hypothetical protein